MLHSNYLILIKVIFHWCAKTTILSAWQHNNYKAYYNCFGKLFLGISALVQLILSPLSCKKFQQLIILEERTLNNKHRKTYNVNVGQNYLHYWRLKFQYRHRLRCSLIRKTLYFYIFSKIVALIIFDNLFRWASKSGKGIRSHRIRLPIRRAAHHWSEDPRGARYYPDSTHLFGHSWQGYSASNHFSWPWRPWDMFCWRREFQAIVSGWSR